MKSNTGAAFMMWRGNIEPRLSASGHTELAGALQQPLAHNRQIGGSGVRSADFIAVRVERQTDRLATINAEVATTETRLHELDFDPAP